MFFIKICLILVSALPLSRAFDLFTGLIMQGEPCFETFDFEECNTTIPNVFTPTYKGTNTNAQNTEVWLFTTKNKEKAEPLHKCGGKLPKNSAFDPEQETIIVIGGIIESICRVAWNREFKDQFLTRGNYNVILVDWTWGNLPDPVGGVINSYVVGEHVGFVIKNIMLQNNYKDGSKFYVIGHSAGVYAANTAGRIIREWKPTYKLRRITLLDPGVLRLKDGDIKHNTSYQEAYFVDVMHTDGGTCFPDFGLQWPSGHADFYPNGGAFEVACYYESIEAILKGDYLYALGSILSPIICSHLQVVQFYKVSINHPAGLQVGAMCDSYDDFLSGACKRCCKEEDFSNCAVAGFDAEQYFPHKGEPRMVRRYYYELGLACPYNENYEFSILKDC